MKTQLLILSLSVLASCSNNAKSDEHKTNLAQNDTIQKIDDYLTQLSKEKNFSGGVLIVKNGKQILEKGYGFANKEQKIPFTFSTLASMGSITKAFTAAAILKLAEQNKLSLDDNLKKFFPMVPADKANITIHQLLNHSSGFHEFLQDDGGDYEIIKTEDFLNRAFTEPLAFKPGEKAVYTNVGMSILGIIIEQVSGMDYEAYLKKNLFEPIGINNIGYHCPLAPTDMIAIGYQNGKPWGTIPSHIAKAGGGPYWNLKANGGLEISLDDMLLWTNAISNHTILSEASVQKMFTEQILEDGYDGKSSFGYGCNIMKSRRNTKMIDNGGSNGIYFARLIRLPEEGLIFYIVTNESSMNANKVLPNITQLYFQGKISEDATSTAMAFQNPTSLAVYKLLENEETKDLKTALKKNNLQIEDDMILLDVGEKLIEEKKAEKALVLYKYYTAQFPKIIVAWNDMGDVYLMMNNKEEAVKCYREALKLRPENQRAQENLKQLGY